LFLFSLGVPAISETISLSSLINLFMNVDLPALGLPSTAIFFPSGVSYLFFGRDSFIKDLKSEIFLECSALISKNSLIPIFEISSFTIESVFLSDLFRTVINFLFNFLSLVRISKSSLIRFSEPSIRNIIKLASSAAIHACSAISSFSIELS
jgi:hypothetical protein